MEQKLTEHLADQQWYGLPDDQIDGAAARAAPRAMLALAQFTQPRWASGYPHAASTTPAQAAVHLMPKTS
jgi:hypothetical protein